MMVYIVCILNYYSIKYYNARAMHSLCMFNGFITILVHKNTLHDSYDTICYFFDSYRMWYKALYFFALICYRDQLLTHVLH